MPITINGSGTITGISVGGLHDRIVDTDMLDNNAVATGKIADNAVTNAKSTGLGISMADQYRITGTGTLNTDATTQLNDAVSCSWERSDSDSAGFVGTGVTENDGVFTFPSTGVYQIIGNLVVSRDAAENRYANFNLEVSTDGGSSYDIAAMGSGGFGQVYQRDTCSLCFLLDVTNTSNVKVRFSATTNRSNVLFRGDTGANYSAVIFIRVGDT